MQTEKITARICVYMADRGFGTLQTDSGEKLWFHVSQVDEETKIAMGAIVQCRVHPVKQGKLPTAIEIEILDEVGEEGGVE